MSSYFMMLNYVMAGVPTVRMTSGNTPVACGDNLPDVVTPRGWLVSVRFPLRITCFGAEDCGVIGGGFPAIPILVDLLKMAFSSLPS